MVPQSVPGHPEAKSDQNLIRNGLLEALLEASLPASKPASQAQPLARDFSTKRRVSVQARVFSTNLAWAQRAAARNQNGLQEAISN